MADTEELKQMILSFRRAELVELLGFAGLNKMGVKATLLQRAVTLIQSQRGCSVPVQIKIRELNRRRFPGKTMSPPHAQISSSNSNPHTSGFTDYKHSLRLNSAGPVDFSSSQTRSQQQPNGIPVHPDVRLKRLPYYDILGELLKPTSLVPRSTSRLQDNYFQFHLTPQQAQDIAMSRDFRPGAKCEYTIQIQLRFCLLETSCEQEDNFPPSICVRVNGKLAQLPNPIPTSKPGVEPKRPGRPVDITSACRLSPTLPNHIEISWASEYGRGYCVSVNLVKRLTADILLHRLKQFGNRHADHTRAIVKEKLSLDPDSEIATTSLRVSLLCPLGKMRMTLPCRASTCNHLQCFNAMTYLMMNEKKPTWGCPVCDKAAPFHKLIIDGLFVEILRMERESTDIQFNEDGSWHPLKANKETHVIASPVVSKSAPAAATIDCSSNDSTSASPTKKAKMDVIDLTLDSSDEEEEPPGPTSLTRNTGCVSPPVINIDSPVQPHSVSSVSSTDSPRRSLSSSQSSHSSPASASSFSPSSSSTSSESSSRTIGYQLPSLNRPESLSPMSPTGTNSQSPLGSPSYSSPHVSPLQHHNPIPPMSPISPVSPSLSTVPSMAAANYMPPPPFPNPIMSMAQGSYAPLGPMSIEAVDREIEEFLNGLEWDPYR